MEHGDIVSVTPLECSVKGGEQLVLTFCNPVAVPDESTVIFSRGSQDSHKVPTTRLSPNSLVAPIPSHGTAEMVELRLCSVDEKGVEKTLYMTNFTYFFDHKVFTAEVMLQSMSNDSTSQLLYGLLPPLSSAEAVRDYDMYLTEAMSEVAIPEGWNMVGSEGKGGNAIITVEDCEAKETLLHFAARHGLNSLAQHLLSLPGSSIAAVLSDLEGNTPIQIAKNTGNEGLVQLLSLYMKQVRPDGVFIESPVSSPHQSPIHVLNRVEGDGGMQSQSRWEEAELVRINKEWRSQVWSHRKNSLGGLPVRNDVTSRHLKTELSPRLNRRRRSLCAFINVPPKDAVGVAKNYEHLECVNRVHDPEIQEMDRLRRISWSATVGATDSRSIDTGLNELHRITAEEVLQKRLACVRSELMEMEQGSRSSSQLCPTQSQLTLRSLSCPMLDKSDDEEEEDESFTASNTSPHKTIEKSSLSASAILESTHTAVGLPSTSHEFSPKDIPRLITTSDMEVVLHSDANTASLSASVDDLENSSGDQLDFHSHDGEGLTSKEHSQTHLQEEDGMAPGYSISAPDLFQGLSDSEQQSPEGEGQSPEMARPLAAVSVEESIMEHRSLHQVGAYSPVSDEVKDTGTDHTNTSVDSDFVIVQSPSQQKMTAHNEATDSDVELKSLTKSVEVTKRSAVSAHQGKSHRRSLSTSDVESMREIHKSVENNEDRHENIGEEEVRGFRPNTSTNCIAVITPISNADDGEVTSGQSSARKLDIDEQSQADSVQTMDTNSHHGSDDSSDEENETDDQLSALDSQVSVETSEASGYRAQMNYNGVSKLSPVVLRGKRRSANPLDRYSAECLTITNIDDELAMESDEGGGEVTPTSIVNHFSHRRINSTSFPLSAIGHSDMDKDPPTEDYDGSQDVLNQFPLDGNLDGKKTSMCSNDSVFASNSQNEVIHLSDVDVKVNSSDDLLAESLETSLDVSLEQSDKYYTRSGVPRTIRKQRFKKSSGRKEGSPKTERKGLKASDVSPTIRTLKHLMNMEEVEDSFSDDSDTTVGSGPVRTSSALGRASASSIQRSKSSVSDSITLRQENRPSVTFANTVPGYRSSSPSSEASRSHLQPDPDSNQDEGSSLEFHSTSPLLRKQQQIYGQPTQPASPLSFSVTKSPPTSSKSLSSEPFRRDTNQLASASSPTFPVSPIPDTTLEEEMEFDRAQHLPRERKIGKMEKSKSLYEKGTEPVTFFVDPKDTTEDCKVPLDKDHEGSAVKKFIRGSFFRGSKQNSKKAASVKVSTPSNKSESDQDSPMVSAAHSKRVKSAKVRVKPGDMEQAPCSPSSNITRSTSMQVGLQDIKVELKPAPHITRHKSDDMLVSPTKIRNARSLTVLEENGQSVAFPFPPAPHGSGGESDLEESTNMEHIKLTVNHPELHLKEDMVWERTVDRKVYKKINKSERERQAILHELLHTEKQHFRALHVLKLIFRQGISKVVPEETLNVLFPKLEELIDISKDFIRRMDKKKEGNMINDLSDVLLEQFSGEKYDEMLAAFSGFCSGHLNAMEIYKELYVKKKNFMRLMNELHGVKECQRLTLPDYYTKVTQRLSQLITLMKRLAKKTESLRLDHCPILLRSMSGLQHLVAAVDQSVEDSKNLMELTDIQTRLEINVPKSSKITNRQDLKHLNLTVHNRKLKKRGDATWMGHGRQLGVQIVLVTDFLVLLTERDQKFHIATLQDLKPPVIRLYDLMVRPNASVKSGVQLLLVEQSSTPEMYKLDFVDKKKAKEWLSALNGAIEDCKEKGLKCEYFGAERVTSGDEDKKHEDKEAESGEEGKAARAIPNVLPSKSDPEVQRHKRAKDRIDLAEKLMSALNTITADRNAASRHQAPPASTNPKGGLNLRNRSQTVRPKTAYFTEETDGGSSATIPGSNLASGEHVISYPQLVPQSSPSKPKPSKEKEKKKVSRSSTFRTKEKKAEEKKEEKEKLASVTSQRSEEDSARSEQLYVSCISGLKASLEEVMNESDEKSKMIAKLQTDITALQKSHQKSKRKDQVKKPPVSAVTAAMPAHQQSPRTSPLPSQHPPRGNPPPQATPLFTSDLTSESKTGVATTNLEESRGQFVVNKSSDFQ